MNLGPPTTEEQKRSQVIVFSFLILTFLFFRFNFFFFLFQQDLATVDWFEERLRAPERGFARSAYLQVCFVLFCCVSVFFFIFFFFILSKDRAAISSISWSGGADERDT